MEINQKIIKTEATLQVADPKIVGEDLTNFTDLYSTTNNSKFVPLNDSHYFLVSFDGPPSSKTVTTFSQINSEYDSEGNEIGVSVDDIQETVNFFNRVFFLYKDEGNEENKIKLGIEVGNANVIMGGSAAAAQSIDENFKFAQNSYTENLKKLYDYKYENSALTLSKKEVIVKNITPFENLCDIILAETIKSYLL